MADAEIVVHRHRHLADDRHPCDAPDVVAARLPMMNVRSSTPTRLFHASERGPTMRRRTRLFSLALLASSPALAFDTQTHAYLTYQAFLNSNVGNVNAPALLKQIGLDRFDPPQPFSPYWLAVPFPESFYFDNVPSGATPLQYERAVTAYEWTQLQQLAVAGRLGTNSSSLVGSTPIQTLPIANWLMRGAIREDDLLPSYYDPRDGAAPDPDPYQPILRVYNHFYDPIYNQKLHIGVDCSSFPSGPPLYGYTFCSKAVDWALGTVDAFAALTPDPSRHQHFSWEDSRNNFFLALTAERDANGNGVREASEREADSEERLFRWATMFRSLGDTVHLLQDMAQPQHTRNDRHDPHVDPQDQQGFEPFTNARLIGIAAATTTVDPSGGQVYVRSLSGNALALPFFTPLPDISGYPVPAFVTPLRFFTTRAPGDGPGVMPDSRLGMADYTNKGFFTRGTTPDIDTSLAGVFTYSEPDRSLTGFTPHTTNCSILPKVRGQNLFCTTYDHTVPDPAQPSRADVTTPQPLLAKGIWKDSSGSINNSYTITPQVYQAMGNLTVPRAIAYSAGIINYFFRGTLDVTSPNDRIVAVLNQGAQHTMNAQGYPCVGTSTVDGCPIFGFHKVRVRVRNLTQPITESGPSGALVNQTVGASGTLVAVARYHRNTCYKPDLTGERVQSYAPSPQLIIAEPTCGPGQTARTAYQEISVSAALPIASTTDLPGGDQAGPNPTTPYVEKLFDFTNDPIPVNATDLFIQLVYRGPLGQEPDAVAVGTLDVREPTFTAFWNNTDYFWNSGWVHENGTYHNEGIQQFWSCMGGFPLKMVFEYDGGIGTPAMIDPVVSPANPGMVRLGVIFPPPDFPTQLKTIQGTPVHYSGDALIIYEQAPTSGMFRQANLENIAANTLTAPYANCSSGLPTGAQYWCFDPIQKRRGQLFGTPDIPLFLAPFGGASSATDVDSGVPLPQFTGTVPLATGTNRFDTDTPLANCTAQPAIAPTSADYQAYLRHTELLEEARDLGVSGESEPPLQPNH
jgi:hypothetical protein